MLWLYAFLRRPARRKSLPVRPRLAFEELESRVTPSVSVGGEYMLQLINGMRADPAATLPMLLNANDANINNALSYFNVNISVLKQQWASLMPAPPLAWNAALESSSAAHSQLMLQDGQQAHQLPGEADPGTRMADAGYAPAGTFDWGENIYAYSPSVFDGFAAFAIDWGSTSTGIQSPPGHRDNMMAANFQEIGVGFASAPAGSALGPLLITEDFGGGRSGFQPDLLGAVFNDTNNDKLYEPGEGLGGVTVTISGSGGDFSTTTDSSGAYQIALPSGTYTVTASGGSLAGPIVKNVTMGGNNVLLNLTPGALVVTSQPTGAIVPAGDQATFTATADGSPAATVQWQVSTNGGVSFTNISGANSATLTFTAALADNGDEYRAVFSNGADSVYTRAVTLTVRAAPEVLANPLAQSVSAGKTVTFTAQASGSPKPSVQWQVSRDDGNTFTNIASATLATLTFTTQPTQNGYEYRAVFTSILGTASTAAAQLNVTSAPVISVQPARQMVAANATASFTAAVIADPPAAVQWQVSTNGGTSFTNINGATANTLTFTAGPADSGKRFRAVFTNALGTVRSAAAGLVVDAMPTIVLQPKDQTRNSGQQATFTASATGTSAAGIQWQMSKDSGNSFRDISGATSPTLSFTAQGHQNGYELRALFINGVCQAATNAATLTVISPPVVTVQPGNQTTTANSQVTFTAAAGGNPGPSAVQWQVSTNQGLSFSNIAGAVANTLTVTAAPGTSGNWYRAVFGNALGKTATRAALLTIAAPVSITRNPTSLTSIAGQQVTLTAAASGTAPRVQWQVSTDGGNTFNNIPGATFLDLTFTTQAAQDGREYRAVFSNAVSQAITTAATLTVHFAPLITAQPAPQMVVFGNQATFTATVNSDPALTAIQWQVSANGGLSFSNISGATAAQLIFTPALTDNGKLYRVLFTNALGTTASKPAPVHVGIPPTLTAEPTDQSVQRGQRVTFTASAGGTPAPQVQWQASTDGGATFTNIAGATSASLSFLAQAQEDGNEYRAVFSNTGGTKVSTAAELGVS